MALNSIADVLNQWQSWGVFDYILPFLLIFAVVYGVLSMSKILGENRGVHVVISLVVALLALQGGWVQDFFSQIFPRAAVGISILLVLVVLVAAFIPASHLDGWKIALYSVGALVALIVVFNSFDVLGWTNYGWWNDWGALIIGGLLIVGVILVIILPGRGEEGKPKKSG